MANVNLTTDLITNEALRVLHQKLNFSGNLVTDYDDSFAKDGAKIGDTIRVRLPIQYATGTGSTIATGTGADSIGVSTTLQVNTQRNVPMRFTSAEMTMDIDEFSSRHIEPAMAKLAAMIENDNFGLLDYVPNVTAAGTKVEFADIMNARAGLQNRLAPNDGRIAIMDTQGNVDLVVDNKGLFEASGELSKQYKEGSMGRFGSFDFYENSIIPTHTNGTEAGTAYLVNGASQSKTLSKTDPDPNTGSLIVDTGTKTIKAGQVFTIGDDVFDVHPETKASTGVLKQFTVTADATGAGTLTITPAIIASGPHQNVSAVPDDDDILTFVGAASTAYKQSVLFQKGFAAFGTADLVLPPNQKASRKVYDGISLRIIQDYYDGVKDRLYTRLDVLYGNKILRPDLAQKIWHT
jgi:hypothetical protein